MSSGVPIVDIIVNIDMFTAKYEDSSKMTKIMVQMFKNSREMRKLLHMHGELILTVLVKKYEDLRKMKNIIKQNVD